MKPALFFAFSCFSLLCYGQIYFEEIVSPKDFSLSAIRKSPTGEYFAQAYNDRESIYRSANGQDWVKEPLPISLTMDDIQFFSDGTPLLKSKSYDHLIRRNGAWHLMQIWGPGNVRASFIKEDSLFVFQYRTFSYSLDKGQTFTTVFTFNDLTAHTAYLLKLDNHFVLHHTAGTSNWLSIFNAEGEQIFTDRLGFGNPGFMYSDCGEVLLISSNTYYHFRDDGLGVEQGSTSDIIPNYSSDSDLLSQGGHYYLREGNTVYKSPGCGFNWQPLVTDSLIQAKTEFWVNAEEDILLYDSRRNRYFERPGGANQWEEHAVDIDYPYIYQLGEAAP
ncbi:MAG: hypothetical protein H6559_38310 [Lewinellaceae bacterium]|nr:hypothetical protein [Lewinellaceae bacterium]